MNLSPPINYIAQKLLYLWVKIESLENKCNQPLLANSELRDNKVIIYVLESRAWSDLLVLNHESKSLKITQPQSRIILPKLKEWHHVYTVAQANPLKAWLQQKPKRSTMLAGIHEMLLDNPEIDVYFVPTVVFWGRPVLKQKHWLRILFSDTWGLAGRFRRFFTILINGRNTLIQFSPAISFRELIDQPSNDVDAITQLQTMLTDRLTEIKTATLGPDVSHRRILVRGLLENEAITQAIINRSIKDDISKYAAAKIALKYLNEIVADRSYITIQIFQRVLTNFWNKFYSGIDVNFSEELKELALTHELVYTPCHRSHVDYLLLSYVIHREGLVIPYIAAGKNLNMPVIGPILRKSGAFFIRRSFKGNALYSTVMFEYVASQLATGMPIEYFIEGGRSRTGRLLQPKPGMLAMTIRAFLKYKNRPVAFIPVYIGYEKMLESKSYLAELKGDDKKSETFLSSLRSILKLRGYYGRATTSFGKPVLLNTLLDKVSPDWKTQPYDDTKRPDWLKAVVYDSSTKIMQGINDCCAVNAINLVSTALLATTSQAMDENELIRILSFYNVLITGLNYSDRITLTRQNPEELIARAEALNLIHRRKHEMGDFIYLDSSHAILLTYYRNNTLHLFALPSLIACCFNNTQKISREKIIQYISTTFPFLKSEFFLPWETDEMESIVDAVLALLVKNSLLSHEVTTDIFIRPGTSTMNHAKLTNLAQVVSPVLELYYMIFALLAGKGSDTLSRTRLEELCHLMAQRISLMYQKNSPDFFDKKLIANFINSLIRLEYVSVNETGNLAICEIAANKGREARRLLDKNMQYNILQMLRTPATAD